MRAACCRTPRCPKQTAAGVRAVYGPKVRQALRSQSEGLKLRRQGLATLAAARSAALQLRRRALSCRKHHQCTICARHSCIAAVAMVLYRQLNI